MFADDHHHDGRVAVWLPVPPGLQEGLIASSPETFFKPPYVGVRGWIGINLDCIDDEDLDFYIEAAWEQIAPKRLASSREASRRTDIPPRPTPE
jgi:hypothetical protein